MNFRLLSCLFMVLLMLLLPQSSILIWENEMSAPDDGTALPLDIQLLGIGNIDDPSVVSDSQGNFHIIWIENLTSLMYARVGPSGNITHGPLIQNFDLNNVKYSTTVAVDENDNLHYSFLSKSNGNTCLRYVAVDSSTDAIGDLWFNPITHSYGSVVCKSNSFKMSNPDIAVDSQGSAHIVWQDIDDPLNNRYGLFGIRYAMMEANWTTHTPDSPIFDTMLTPGVSESTHPKLDITDEDEVVVTWQDTRSSKIELVFLVDTSGSMNNQWGYLCTLLYGGSMSSGGNFAGLKQLLHNSSLELYETIYMLSSIPSTMSCGISTGGGGPRNSPLGLVSNDHSGGLRFTGEVVYNGAAINISSGGGYYGEFWGPATTWACSSWRDSNSNVPGNPPTQWDHKWNPNAVKIVLPISDEGPYGGDPIDSSDTASINEAHDACVLAGVKPMPLYSGSNSGVVSAAIDLAMCPGGQISTGSRTCPASTGSVIRTTDAGGKAYSFNSFSQSSASLLINEIISSASTSVWTTILDPYAKLSDATFQRGNPAYIQSGGNYYEDIGWGGLFGNHFVVVNDTRISSLDDWSSKPNVAISSDGLFQYVWSDSRDVVGNSASDSHEIYWQNVDLSAWDFNGQANGIDIYSIQNAVSNASSLSPVEGVGLAGSRDVESHSSQPSLIIDDSDVMHVAWVEHDSGLGTNISYRRSINATTSPTQFLPNPWYVNCNSNISGSPCSTPTYPLSDWDSKKNGAGDRNVLINTDENDGDEPSIAVTKGGGKSGAVVWVDSEPCGLYNSTGSDEYLCIKRIRRSMFSIVPVSSNVSYTLEPSEQVTINFTIDHMGSPLSNPIDVELDWSGLPSDWGVYAEIDLGQGMNVLNQLNSTWQIPSGGTVPLSLTISAPSKFLAINSEQNNPVIGIVPVNSGGGAFTNLEINLDVRHNLVVSAPQNSIQIEQGNSGILTIDISNYGNIVEDIFFPDSTTLAGQLAWGLPYGWNIDFVNRIDLIDNSTTSKMLRIYIPDDQLPGATNLTVVATSHKVSQQGEPGAVATYDLTVHVIRKRVGNIIFELYDSFEELMPGDCGYFSVDITKHFGDDNVVISVVDGPEERPESVSLEVWRETHWILNIDYSALPGGNLVEPDAKRFFTNGLSRTIFIELCSPFKAGAGDVGEVQLRAELFVDSLAYDIISMQATVLPKFSVLTNWHDAPTEINPGQAFEVTIDVENDGNMPISISPSISSQDDDWSVSWVNGTPDLIDVGDELMMVAIVNVPIDALAGNTQIELEFLSMVNGPPIQLGFASGSIEVLSRTDLVILSSDTQSNDFDISPGQTIDIHFTIINNGNIAENPWLDNYTTGASGVLSEIPRMDGLPGINATWFEVENAGTLLSVLDEISSDSAGRFRISLIEPGQERSIVLRITMVDYYSGWFNDQLGVRINSDNGYAIDGGDIDADDKWSPLDSNEQLIELNVKIPDVYVNAVSEDLDGDELVLQIEVSNIGNVPVENILLRVCDMRLERAEITGCSRSDAVAEVRVSYIEAANGNSPTTNIIAIRITDPLDYIVLSIDAEEEILESDETNNMMEKQLLLSTDGSNGFDTLFGIKSNNLLYGLMFVLWGLIVYLGISAISGRMKDRKMASGWQKGGSGWDSSAIKSSKVKKKNQVDPTPYAEVHSLDMSMSTRPSVDVSDLDLSQSVNPSQSIVGESIDFGGNRDKKEKSDEFTIGDLIDDLI